MNLFIGHHPPHAEDEELAVAIPRPEDLLQSPEFSLFTGSTGGYVFKDTCEYYDIIGTAEDPLQFEMITCDFCYLWKREQCLASDVQARKIEKDGTVIFMHPADGVFPEKVNKGRVR
eukprot:CAMPEP_0171060668 /NCGR_PEP_ID=MMETSP0766_2-20121228/3971_1 /TAXON_ID=439317 /ORGANISM="Gambierdiscus australes, Strain CAWD 149" /LENGTH=116 /DNA_ID=CAMNT_0011516269 /DNA_START=130 /DNA_END=480 /DNA_ORIENTATION=+